MLKLDHHVHDHIGIYNSNLCTSPLYRDSHGRTWDRSFFILLIHQYSSKRVNDKMLLKMISKYINLVPSNDALFLNDIPIDRSTSKQNLLPPHY